MPGPKMGARPVDFNEEVVRQSPTFAKWLTLEPGQTLRYACREFVRGHDVDEERLMRRIMIARRNNLRDHDTLKRARQCTTHGSAPTTSASLKKQKVTRKNDRSTGSTTITETTPSAPVTTMLDHQVEFEMDIDAVEATRSYKAWQSLSDGKEFVYNQKYVKGKEGQDWLLRKNIWRRMRYRRENKKMVEKLKDDSLGVVDHDPVTAAAGIVDQALLAAEGLPNQDGDSSQDFVNKAVVEAAVAAAENYAKSNNDHDDPQDLGTIVGVANNPLSNEALDAAAKLAAATTPMDDDDDLNEYQNEDV